MENCRKFDTYEKQILCDKINKIIKKSRVNLERKFRKESLEEMSLPQFGKFIDMLHRNKQISKACLDELLLQLMQSGASEFASTIRNIFSLLDTQWDTTVSYVTKSQIHSFNNESANTDNVKPRLSLVTKNPERLTEALGKLNPALRDLIDRIKITDEKEETSPKIKFNKNEMYKKSEYDTFIEKQEEKKIEEAKMSIINDDEELRQEWIKQKTRAVDDRVAEILQQVDKGDNLANLNQKDEDTLTLMALNRKIYENISSEWQDKIYDINRYFKRQNKLEEVLEEKSESTYIGCGTVLSKLQKDLKTHKFDQEKLVASFDDSEKMDDKKMIDFLERVEGNMIKVLGNKTRETILMAIQKYLEYKRNIRVHQNNMTTETSDSQDKVAEEIKRMVEKELREEYDKEIRMLNREIEGHKSNIKDLSTNLKQTQEGNVRLEKTVESQRKLINKLNEEIITKTEMYEEKIKNLELSISNLTKENETLQSTITRMENEAELLQIKADLCDKFEAENAQLKNIYNILNGHYTSLINSFTDFHDQINRKIQEQLILSNLKALKWKKKTKLVQHEMLFWKKNFGKQYDEHGLQTEQLYSSLSNLKSNPLSDEEIKAKTKQISDQNGMTFGKTMHDLVITLKGNMQNNGIDINNYASDQSIQEIPTHISPTLFNVTQTNNLDTDEDFKKEKRVMLRDYEAKLYKFDKSLIEDRMHLFDVLMGKFTLTEPEIHNIIESYKRLKVLVKKHEETIERQDTIILEYKVAEEYRKVIKYEENVFQVQVDALERPPPPVMIEVETKNPESDLYPRMELIVVTDSKEFKDCSIQAVSTNIDNETQTKQVVLEDKSEQANFKVKQSDKHIQKETEFSLDNAEDKSYSGNESSEISANLITEGTGKPSTKKVRYTTIEDSESNPAKKRLYTESIDHSEPNIAQKKQRVSSKERTSKSKEKHSKKINIELQTDKQQSLNKVEIQLLSPKHIKVIKKTQTEAKSGNKEAEKLMTQLSCETQLEEVIKKPIVATKDNGNQTEDRKRKMQLQIQNVRLNSKSTYIDNDFDDQANCVIFNQKEKEREKYMNNQFNKKILSEYDEYLRQKEHEYAQTLSQKSQVKVSQIESIFSLDDYRRNLILELSHNLYKLDNVEIQSEFEGLIEVLIKNIKSNGNEFLSNDFIKFLLSDRGYKGEKNHAMLQLGQSTNNEATQKNVPSQLRGKSQPKIDEDFQKHNQHVKDHERASTAMNSHRNSEHPNDHLLASQKFTNKVLSGKNKAALKILTQKHKQNQENDKGNTSKFYKDRSKFCIEDTVDASNSDMETKFNFPEKMNYEDKRRNYLELRNKMKKYSANDLIMNDDSFSNSRMRAVSGIDPKKIQKEDSRIFSSKPVQSQPKFTNQYSKNYISPSIKDPINEKMGMYFDKPDKQNIFDKKRHHLQNSYSIASAHKRNKSDAYLLSNNTNIPVVSTDTSHIENLPHDYMYFIKQNKKGVFEKESVHSSSQPTLKKNFSDKIETNHEIDYIIEKNKNLNDHTKLGSAEYDEEFYSYYNPQKNSNYLKEKYYHKLYNGILSAKANNGKVNREEDIKFNKKSDDFNNFVRRVEAFVQKHRNCGEKCKHQTYFYESIGLIGNDKESYMRVCSSYHSRSNSEVSFPRIVSSNNLEYKYPYK